MQRKLLQVGAIVFLALASLPLAKAQVRSSGVVLGTVTDQSGAVVPGAKVTLRNVETGTELTAETLTSGEYQFPVVPVGQYELRVSKQGFKTSLQAQFSVGAVENVRINPIMSVGQVTEQITVNSAPPPVDTVTANEGDTVTGKQVNDLPLDTRLFTQLVLLEPGVSSSLVQTPGFGSNSSIGFSMNGVRDDENNILMDGVRNLDSFGGNAFVTPNLYAVTEFRIENNNYSAATGRDAGAQVNLITRSGTNKFHGNAFEFVRNDDLNARNFFALTVPENRYNDFGYDVGGPIKKDKYFFFWSEEWRRIIQSSGTYLATVPTAAQTAGTFQGVALTNPTGATTTSGGPCVTVTGAPSSPTSIIDPSCLDPNASLLVSTYYPAPIPGYQNGPFNFVSSAPDSTHWREELARLDANFTNKLSASVRFAQDNVTLQNPYGLFDPNVLPYVGASSQFFPIYNYAGHVTYTPKPNFTSEFGWGLYWGTDKFLQNGPLSSEARAPGLDIPQIFPLDELDRIPTLNIGGGYAGINEEWYFHNYSYSMPITNDNTWIRGNHTVKFGVVFTKEGKSELANPSDNNTNGTFTFNGQYTGNALADFVMGRAFEYTETALDWFGNYRWWNLEPYVEDQIKLRPNLTLTVGARYEFYSPEHELSNMLGGFLPSMYDPSEAPTVNASGVITSATGTYNALNGVFVAGKNSPYGDHLFPAHYGYVAPRIGLAWDPTSTGKISVRAGYGVFYDRWGSYTQFGGYNPPFNSSVSIYNTFLSNPAGTANSMAANYPPGLSTALPPWKYPQVQKWSAGVQAQVMANTSVEVSYVGTKGTHLLSAYDLNQNAPNAAVANGTLAYQAVAPYLGWSAITAYNTGFNSSYNALQVSVIRRMQHGLAFQASYTYSKTLTDQSSAWGTPQDSYDIRADKGLASFDVPNVLVFNYTWEIPFFQHQHGAGKAILDGWELAGITTFQSGFPNTVSLPTDNEGTGYVAPERANLVGNWQGPRTLTNWFNTGAFMTPPIATFGDAAPDDVLGPGENNWDIGLYKQIPIKESINLRFRVQFFNAWNHPSFNGIDPGLGTLAFGEVTSALNPRATQFSLELAF